jgi:hypothetical protein
MFRTFVAAIATIAVLVAGSPGLAAAKPKPGGAGKVAATSKAAQRTGSRIGSRVASAGATTVFVQAGATGDGPADDDECNFRAQVIDEAIFVLGQAHSHHVEGSTDYSEIEAAQATLDHVIDRALDRGCYVIV